MRLPSAVDSRVPDLQFHLIVPKGFDDLDA